MWFHLHTNPSSWDQGIEVAGPSGYEIDQEGNAVTTVDLSYSGSNIAPCDECTLYETFSLTRFSDYWEGPKTIYQQRTITMHSPAAEPGQYPNGCILPDGSTVGETGVDPDPDGDWQTFEQAEILNDELMEQTQTLNDIGNVLLDSRDRLDQLDTNTDGIEQGLSDIENAIEDLDLAAGGGDALVPRQQGGDVGSALSSAFARIQTAPIVAAATGTLGTLPVSSCPEWEIPFMWLPGHGSATFYLDQHCSLLPQVAPLLSTMMVAVWTIMGIGLVLRA
jgi:hypothetical protein